MTKALEAGRLRRASRMHAVAAAWLPEQDMVEVWLVGGGVRRFHGSCVPELACLPREHMGRLGVSSRGSALEVARADVRVDLHGLPIWLEEGN